MTAELMLAWCAFVASCLAFLFFMGWIGASQRADRLQRRLDEVDRELGRIRLADATGVLLFPNLKKDLH